MEFPRARDGGLFQSGDEVGPDTGEQRGGRGGDGGGDAGDFGRVGCRCRLLLLLLR